MAFIPVPNAAEVVLKGSQSGANAFITLGFEKGTPFDGGDLENLLDVIGDWWDNELSEHVASSLSMPEIYAVSLETASSPTRSKFDMVHLTGQVPTAPVQDNVAMCVSFYTDSRGRSYRGRNYVPGIPASYLATPSAFATVPTANVGVVYEALATLLEATAFSHVVISRQNGGVPLAVGNTTRVTGYVAKTKIATQRRRIAGTGS